MKYFFLLHEHEGIRQEVFDLIFSLSSGTTNETCPDSASSVRSVLVLVMTVTMILFLIYQSSSSSSSSSSRAPSPP
jgi:hypothetical protein